jgi:tight adherence protein B
MRFGVEMNQALEAFVVRYPLGELRMFAAGLRIAEELGGPLPALLEQLARQIRLRLKLRARVKALSAEARWSAWFLGALPFVLALILSIWRPEHIAVLWNVENGRKLVSIALLLMTIGIFWMRRLVARVED